MAGTKQAPSTTEVSDLNMLKIPLDSGHLAALENLNIQVLRPLGSINVYFSDIEEQLSRWITQADVVVGCVSWLTNRRLLDDLSRRKHVSIVVQKETWLRADESGFAREMREIYDRLPGGISRHWRGCGVLAQLPHWTAAEIDPVRCCGSWYAVPPASLPRMHHKFLCFCRLRHDAISDRDPAIVPSLEPTGVWTGSFNLTNASTRSLENAVVITDPEVAQAYLQEWSQVCALSEPLDWTSAEPQPGWSIES